MSGFQQKTGLFEYAVHQKKLTPRSFLAMFLSIISVFMVVYFLVTANCGTPVAIAHRLLFVLFIMILAFFLHPTKRKNWYEPLNIWSVYDIACVVLAVVCVVYYISDLDNWQLRMFRPSRLDTVFGTIFIFLVMDITRRMVGMTMFCVVLFFGVHTSFANYFPGFLKTAPTPWVRLVDILVSDQGIFSEPVQSMASYIILFLLFGSILEESGAGKYFIDIAYAIGGRFTAGPAKTAAISSALFGSISGSSVSNVVSTGCFTIPLMKSTGYSPEEAGATEAVASTGGNYMPPIMGAVAFVMAQYLKVPYIQIVRYAIIPAMLYYIALLSYIHFDGLKKNIHPMDKDGLPSFRKSVMEGGHLILALVCLVIFLIYGYTTSMGAFWGVVTLFLLTFVRKNTRLKPAQIIKSFEKTAQTSISVGIACAAAGIIIGCMYSSGLSVSLSSIIIKAADGSLLITLIYTALFSLILGCGMPSVGVYLILVTTIIPALTQMGVSPISAHFFAFYFAVVSNITPPVCVAAFAGAAIAEASPMKTGFKAFTIGIAAYIIPFLFVYHPATLAIGSAGEITIAVIDGIIAVVCLSICVAGYFSRRLRYIERFLAFAVSILVVAPFAASNFIAYVIFACIAVLQIVTMVRKKKGD